MKALCNELENVAYKAEKIAIQLGIPLSKIEMFKKDGDFFATTMDFWLKGNIANVPITWEYLVTTLESKHISEIGLAADIKKNYCQKQEKSKGQLK